MSTIQLKAEIYKAVDNMPEKVLTELFEHIKSIQHKSPDREKLYKFIDQVFKEDDEVLRKLAQ